MFDFHDVLHFALTVCAIAMVFDGLRRKDMSGTSFGLCVVLLAGLQILQITGWIGAALSVFQALASSIILIFLVRRAVKQSKQNRD
jgi:hypothetical protein